MTEETDADHDVVGGTPNADDTLNADTGDTAGGDADATGGARTPDIPSDAADEAERLTRLARDADDPAAAEAYRDRRDRIAADHDYTPRVREEDDTLVLYPEEWVEDGAVRFDRIEDTDRAVEVPLSGPGDAARYREVEAYNDAIVERVEAEYGSNHAANVRAFADFMGNHYVRAVDAATDAHRTEFLTEYYPRNVWPCEEQRAVVERSLELIDELADEPRA